VNPLSLGELPKVGNRWLDFLADETLEVLDRIYKHCSGSYPPNVPNEPRTAAT
jgi:hypothetical protein